MTAYLKTSVAIAGLLAGLGSVGAAHAAEAPPAGERADVTPFYGAISPFYGSISPFWGSISPFHGELNPNYGTISPFWGSISPFWGSISPFYGSISPWWGSISPFYGSISPFWGSISPFWEEAGPLWGQIDAQWGSISPFSEADLDALAGDLNELFTQAELVFGGAVLEQTGRSFDDAVLAPLLEHYGLDLSSPESLSDMTASQRAEFFLAFYDGLMAYSGVDRVDHWMATARWSPAIAEAAGLGDRVTIGLVDSAFSADDITVRTSKGGDESGSVAHGAAVASLIASAHDGEGLMGVAPNAVLRTYNPFDETMTADWDAVTEGVLMLSRQKVDVLNLSLGVSGWTFHEGWRDVFSDRQVANLSDAVLFVIAAGNDGAVQSADVDWTGLAAPDNLLVVGSVGPGGVISGFSNQPGEACLTQGGACADGFRLMDRFLVAPGELMLVSDGQGGVTRLSGTSFAAPVVSGAAALVKSRWLWLEAPDIADVLLDSARDLGAPGTDAVYGRGLLDVDAAMSPLDPANLVFLDKNAQPSGWAGLSLLTGALSFHADVGEDTVIMFEAINDTYRDFRVSLDDLIISQDELDLGDNQAAQAWIEEQTRPGAGNGAKFTSAAPVTRTLSARGDLSVSAFAAEADPRAHRSQERLGFQAGVRIENAATGRRFEAGAGEGAFALSSGPDFGLFSDHRPLSGGVNPVLGFASGGAYAALSMPLGAQTRFTTGVTRAEDPYSYVDPFTGEERGALPGLEAYAATAINAGLTRIVGERLTLGASYTRLMERDGLLGAQGAGPVSFTGGSATNAATVSAGLEITRSLRIDASATLAHTAATGFEASAVRLSEAVRSTAWQASVTRAALPGGGALRASLIQPLQTESGVLDYSAMAVADRETGALGLSEYSWALGGDRRLIGELLYEGAAFGERGAYGLFVRAETDAGAAGGVRFDVRF